MVTAMDDLKTKAMSLAAMEVRAGEVAGLLKTLAHPVRLLLACTLAEGEYSVGALEEKLDIHQPTPKTVPSATARMGVPIGPRMSSP